MTHPSRIQRRPSVVQETSRDAFAQHDPTTIDAKMLSLLEVVGSYGATDWEMQDTLKLPHSSQTANRRHLVEKHKVHASEKRRKTPSGRDAIVWRIGPAPAAPAFVVPAGPREQLELGVR